MGTEERGVEHRMNVGFRRKLETIGHLTYTFRYQKGAKESPRQLWVMMVTCERALPTWPQLHIDPLPYVEVLLSAVDVRVTFHGLLSLLQPLLEL